MHAAQFLFEEITEIQEKWATFKLNKIKFPGILNDYLVLYFQHGYPIFWNYFLMQLMSNILLDVVFQLLIIANLGKQACIKL